MTDVAKCLNCGDQFAVSQVRAEYEQYGDEFGDGDYSPDLCSDCLMPRLMSVADQGRAIMMMNGDEDYDDDFVQKWL